MSLQWDLSGIENYQDMCWKENTDEDKKEGENFVLNPITESIINLCGAVGISKLTTNNYKEATKRFAELEAMGVVYLGETNPREDDVLLHVGLVTNADVLDNKKWGNRVRNLIREQAERLINNSKIEV